MSRSVYQNPLSTRYASSKMLSIFSSDKKYRTWRKLWLALAKSQKELGLEISSDQIKELQDHIESIDYEKVAEYEKNFRHDVMAHIHAYGDQCPKAKSIIHLGATSCYVTDNGDLIQYREGLKETFVKLVQVIRNLSQLAEKYKSTTCLGFTHFQPAQPTTVGKRISLWLQNFLNDAKDLQNFISNLPFLGIKGATGTQASLLALFDGDKKAVRSCDQKIAKNFDFIKSVEISGQTYSRKLDLQITQHLTQIAVSANKFATDLRLLSHLGEIEEAKVKTQVGSSAMPYKKNPIYSERICALSRFVKNLAHNTEDTASHQWLERTLDDSANKRIVLPECFLGIDSILVLVIHLSSTILVHENCIKRNLLKELPFLATENILMAGVKKGHSRQDLHEKLRVHTLRVRENQNNRDAYIDLLEELSKDPNFPLDDSELQKIITDSDFSGLSEYQVLHFLKEEVFPFLDLNKEVPESNLELNI